MTRARTVGSGRQFELFGTERRDDHSLGRRGIVDRDDLYAFPVITLEALPGPLFDPDLVPILETEQYGRIVRIQVSAADLLRATPCLAGPSTGIAPGHLR